MERPKYKMSYSAIARVYIGFDEGLSRLKKVFKRRRRNGESLQNIIDLLPEAEEFHTDGWKGYERRPRQS